MLMVTEAGKEPRFAGRQSLFAIILSYLSPVQPVVSSHGPDGEPEASPGTVPEPVPPQDPSTSSPSTAATVTWWTTCTATSTPSCSAAPAKAVGPVPSSTATPCLWGSPCPGTGMEAAI